jgi:hypothetical protein
MYSFTDKNSPVEESATAWHLTDIPNNLSVGAVRFSSLGMPEQLVHNKLDKLWNRERIVIR